MNGYVPPLSAGTWYWRLSTPGKISPLKTSAPDESWISTLCGVPASWLSNSMTNGASAGAVSSVVVNLIPWATSGTTVAFALPDGADVGGGAPEPGTGAAGDPSGSRRTARPMRCLNSSAQHAGYGVAPGAGL